MPTKADHAVRIGVADGSHSRVHFDTPYAAPNDVATWIDFSISDQIWFLFNKNDEKCAADLMNT